MNDYDQYVKSNIYAITPSDIDSSKIRISIIIKVFLMEKLLKTEK